MLLPLGLGSTSVPRGPFTAVGFSRLRSAVVLAVTVAGDELLATMPYEVTSIICVLHAGSLANGDHSTRMPPSTMWENGDSRIPRNPSRTTGLLVRDRGVVTER